MTPAREVGAGANRRLSQPVVEIAAEILRDLGLDHSKQPRSALQACEGALRRRLDVNRFKMS
jgi:hypothetical protein